MTKTKKQSKKFLLGVFSIIATCVAVMFGVLAGVSPTYAYVEEVSAWSNLNFSSNGNLSTVYTSPSGWTKGFSSSDATSGAINLDYSGSSNWYLDETISKLSEDADDYILMINSKSSKNKDGAIPEVQYYTNSSDLTLDAYSNYKIVVWTRVTQNAQASIYLTGLDETIGFERINYDRASVWTPYTFYITTGSNSESIKSELWLGSKVKNTSLGAVFFDNIEVFKISNNETPALETDTNSLVSTPTSKSDNAKYINLDTRVTAPGVNATFESNDLSSWSKTIDTMEVGTYYEILNLESQNPSKARDIEYLGLDLTKNNQNALVLYTDEDVSSYFGLASSDINLSIYDIIKVSLNVKVGSNNEGSAYVRFVENDILNARGEVISSITPVSKEISISSNSENNLTNDYTNVSFYVKGRSLYNTSFKLELWLGSEEEPASGVVAFDNITIEYLSYSEYSNASTGLYATKVDLQSSTDTYGITNSTFNSVQKAESELKLPLVPSNWEHTASDDGDIFYGVINTFSDVYEAHKAEFGSWANPGNPEGFGSVDLVSNNILMMYNFNPAYQKVTSSTFNVDASTYYKLNFAYKLLSTEVNSNELLNVYVIDESENVLYADENISPKNFEWNNYSIYISTNSYSDTLRLVIALGSEDNNVTGIVYIDNVTVLSDDSIDLEAYTNLSKSENVLDFQEGNFNLVKDNGTNIFTALRYTGSLEAGEENEYGSAIAEGGIIDAENTDDEFDIESSPENENALKYMLMIQTRDKATYSMTAKDTVELKTDNYYKFSVWIKTLLTEDDEAEEKYGAEFGLEGLEDKISNIISKEWTEYIIYVNCTSDVNVNLRFALSTLNTTKGRAYFDNYSYSAIEAEEYNEAKYDYNTKSLSNMIFINDTDTPEEEENNSSNSVSAEYLWYAIPTILLAVALLLAIISYFMKKFKIKKWQNKKINEYDREKTVHRDVIRTEAETRRNAKVKELRAEISEYQQEISRIEEIHQEQLKARRQSGNRNITRVDEREFKQYAKMHTALENRVAGLEREIENMNTAEYLLSVQHQIAIEKAKNERLAKEKAYKERKQNKTKN